MRTKKIIQILSFGAVILLYAFRLRSSLWVDETMTRWIIHADLKTLFERVYRYQGPGPVSYLLPWTVGHLLSFDELFLRLPSVLCVFAAALVLIHSGRLIGLDLSPFPAALLLLSPAVYVHAEWARSYGHSLLFFSCATYFTLRYRSEGRGALGFFASALFLAYTQFALAPALIPHVLAIFSAARAHRALRPLVFGALFSTLLLTPLIGLMTQVAQKKEVMSFGGAPQVSDLLFRLFPCEIVLPVFIGGVLACITLRTRISLVRPSLGRSPLLFLAGSYLWAILSPYLLSVSTESPLFAPRYTLVSFVPLSLLLAVLYRSISPVRLRIPSLSVTLVLLALLSLREDPFPEDWRGAVASLKISNGEVVLLFTGIAEAANERFFEDEGFLEYFESPLRSYPLASDVLPLPLDLADLESGAYFSNRLLPILKSGRPLRIVARKVLVIARSGEAVSSGELLREFMLRFNYQETERDDFGNVTTSRYLQLPLVTPQTISEVRGGTRHSHVSVRPTFLLPTSHSWSAWELRSYS